MQEVSSRRPFYAAINFIYKSLQDDREQADISHIIRELHKVIAEAVQPSTGFSRLLNFSSADRLVRI